jgi:HlyD family secretion protein
MTNPTSPVDTPTSSTVVDLQAILGDGHARRWWQRPALWSVAAVVIALAAGLIYWQTQKDSSAQPTYVTEVVKRGNLTLTVLANGTSPRWH